MRRRLTLVFVAVSSIVAIAFVVPLAFLVRTTAEDRAIDAARADAAAVVPTLVSDMSRSQLEAAVGATTAGAEGRMTVTTASGLTVGPVVTSSRVDAALTLGVSDIGGVEGGQEVVAAVSGSDGQLSAVRVFVSNQDLRQGQWAAWTALAVVAAVLVGLSVVVADRLARTVVKPTEELGAAAKRLGAGDLDARVVPDGPAELVELAVAFNELGARISSMLDHERELVAELSHRLRTPLTALAMRVEQVEDAQVAWDLRADVEWLTTVVNDLIAEARELSLSDEGATCDAATVVADRVEYWSVLADDQGRSWRFDRDATRADVNVGESGLSAALDVLIENVFAHTDEGTALIVAVAASDGIVRIGVGDAGFGFDGAMMARGESEGGSTGLGLHIARRTAVGAGGHIELSESELGGALVELVLPIVTPI